MYVLRPDDKSHLTRRLTSVGLISDSTVLVIEPKENHSVFRASDSAKSEPSWAIYDRTSLQDPITSPLASRLILRYGRDSKFNICFNLGQCLL